MLLLFLALTEGKLTDGRSFSHLSLVYFFLLSRVESSFLQRLVFLYETSPFLPLSFLSPLSSLSSLSSSSHLHASRYLAERLERRALSPIHSPPVFQVASAISSLVSSRFSTLLLSVCFPDAYHMSIDLFQLFICFIFLSYDGAS